MPWPQTIYDELPLGSRWCEIKDGKDFFAWSEAQIGLDNLQSTIYGIPKMVQTQL